MSFGLIDNSADAKAAFEAVMWNALAKWRVYGRGLCEKAMLL